MNEYIGGDSNGVASAGGDFAQLAADVARISALLGGVLDVETQLGTDPGAQRFTPNYIRGRVDYVDGVDGLRGELEFTGEGLKALAGLLDGIENNARDISDKAFSGSGGGGGDDSGGGSVSGEQDLLAEGRARAHQVYRGEPTDSPDSGSGDSGSGDSGSGSSGSGGSGSGDSGSGDSGAGSGDGSGGDGGSGTNGDTGGGGDGSQGDNQYGQNKNSQSPSSQNPSSQDQGGPPAPCVVAIANPDGSGWPDGNTGRQLQRALSVDEMRALGMSNPEGMHRPVMTTFDKDEVQRLIDAGMTPLASEPGSPVPSGLVGAGTVFTPLGGWVPSGGHTLVDEPGDLVPPGER